MIPSSKWFSASLQERAAWYGNFDTQFQVVGPILGFAPADVTAVTNDNQVMQFLAAADLQLKAYEDAVRQFRILMTEGDVGDPVVAFPSLPTYGTPTAVPRGLFERLDSIVKRARVTPAYTAEIGALLGILPQQPNGNAPETLQPSLKATPMPGSVVQIKFVRGNTDGLSIETRIDNSDTWSDAGKFFKSPAELLIPQNSANLPRSVQVRARYVDGNNPVGQFSDIVTTATQPEG